MSVFLTKSFLAFAFIALTIGATGQVTKIRGVITDDQTGESLPFVNVAFKGSPVGTITGTDGSFYIETRMATDTLVVSYLGYQPYKSKITKGGYNELKIRLIPETYQVAEVVIKPGENPAHAILKKIQVNKEKNNPENYLNTYSYEVYSKFQVDINNFDTDVKDRKVLNQVKFVFDHIDTNALTGKVYLPVLIAESVSDFYYQRKPSFEREVIKASRISGVDNASVHQFTGKMYQKFNIYDNFMTLFEPGFVSPISDYGLLYYKYYLIDSAMVGSNWCYQISYQPKRTLERTFSGYFWVADTSFAIKSIQMQFGKDANINFLNNFSANLEYSFTDSVWFLAEEKIVSDFNLTNQTFGFFGTKTSVYQNVKVNHPLPDSILGVQTNTLVLDEAPDRPEEYWTENRPMELTEKEKTIYSIVDSVQTLPVYRTAENLVSLLVNYYYVKGPFEYGPYFTFYSHNPIEGHRLRFGGRTSNQFSKKIMLDGYLAYGTYDTDLKYGLGYTYMFHKNPRSAHGMSYYDDMKQQGISSNAFREDNILTTIFRREANDQLTRTREFSTYYERDLFNGFTGRISFRNREVFSSAKILFEVNTGPLYDTLRSIKTSEITLYARYAKDEKYLWGSFERVSLGTKSPVFELAFTTSLKYPQLGDFEYYKLQLNVSDKLEVSPFGYFKYNFEAGKYLGRAPYLFLKLHPGNETFAYDYYAFNLMNYYEFASDEYLSFIGEQHFQGLFLNRIPLLRRLEFREVAGVKAAIGNIDARNLALMRPPEGMSDLNHPYVEVNAGIENILKFGRVDAVWRLTHTDKPNVSLFGIRMMIQFIL